MQQTNPLQQYFRRPSVYLKLPSGGAGYPTGSIDLPDNGEVPVYPMTAIDEITVRTPDALFNGTAVAEVIKSCVPNIKDPWSVTNVDLDPLLVAIKAATNGSEMDMDSVCPKCDEPGKYTVNLTGILAGFTPGDYQTPLSLGTDVQIKFKPLSFKRINETSVEQFNVRKAVQAISQIQDEAEQARKSKEVIIEVNKLATEIVAEGIEYIKTPNATVMEKDFILEFLKNVDTRTYEKIKDHNIKLKTSTESKPLKMKCVSCQHEYEQPFSVNAADFFD